MQRGARLDKGKKKQDQGWVMGTGVSDLYCVWVGRERTKID